MPSWTIRIGAEIWERGIPGCLFNSLTFRFAHAENLKAVAEVVGSPTAEVTGSIQTPTLSELQPFVFHQATITLAGSDKTTEIYDGRIVINNNIPLRRGSLGSRYFLTKRYGQRSVTGNLSLYFEDNDERNRFLVGSEFALNVKLVGSQIGATGYYYTIEVDMPKCVYLRDTSPHILPISEPLVLDAPFQAFYDSTSGYEIEVYLTNEITGY